MAAINIIGYAYYMKPPSPGQAPEVKISEAAYLALGQKGSTVPIQYAYKRPVFDTPNGNPFIGDTFLDEAVNLVTWSQTDFDGIEIKPDIFN